MAASLTHPGLPQDNASWRLTSPAGLKGWLRRRRYRSRLVAGMLGVILPLMLVFAAILTARASTSLSASSERKGAEVARAVTLRLEDWLGERQGDLTTIADQASRGLADPLTASLVDEVDKTSADFTVIEVTDLTGRVLASSHPEKSFDPSGQGTFRTAASGQPVLDTIVALNGHLRWNLQQPVLDATGHPQGVVVGDLDPTVLATLLNPELDAGSEVVADACVTAAFCWMVVAASSSEEAERTTAAEFTSIPDCLLSSAIARNLRASLVPKSSAAAAATTAPRATTTTAPFRWLLTGARTVAARSCATMPQLRSLTRS